MTKDPNDIKDRISVALRKRTIKALDDEARKDGRSRSDTIQRILDRHLQPQSGSIQEAKTSEIPFKMG